MSLTKKLEEIRFNIARAQEKSGSQNPIEIVGVTKTHPFSFIEESYRVGLRSIGENRIQEANIKFESFEKMPKLNKRFIGHLQSNKAKKCVELFDSIDSIDSIKTLRKVGRYSKELKKNISILIEINTSGESQKHGFLPSQKEEILECFLEQGLGIDGLMTVGPKTSNKNKIRKSFCLLREIKEWIESEGKIKLKHLSMGMSGDYEIAIEEGSTMVRLGSLLYGSRI
jgi:pyridoxal phosphate enzyme (YggS family)